jgi:hypothetical protein
MKFLGGLLAVLVAAIPTALVLTLLTWRLWGWIEQLTGIESLGHSGPASWCFGLVYGLCVGAGLILLAKLRRRGAQPINRP